MSRGYWDKEVVWRGPKISRVYSGKQKELLGSNTSQILQGVIGINGVIPRGLKTSRVYFGGEAVIYFVMG